MFFEKRIEKRDFIPILLLFQNSLFLYVAIFLHSISFLSWLRYSLFPFLFIVSILLVLKTNVKVFLGDLIYVFGLVTILLVNDLAFPDNSLYLHYEFLDLSWCCFGGFIFGLSVYGFFKREEEREWQLLYSLSVVSMIIMIVYSLRTFSSGNVMSYLLNKSDMATAYNCLPCLMIICWRAIKNPNVIRIILFGLSVVYIISLGTRGAMLCLLAFIVVCVFFQLIVNKSLSKGIVVIGGLLALFSFGDKIIILLKVLFDKFGFSQRIFDSFYSGNILVSNSRNETWDRIMPYIKEHWLFGNGLFSDRRILGVYTHNIVLEVLLDFGIIAGVIILLFALYIIVRALIVEKSLDIKCLIIALTISTVGKLLVSSSYLCEPLLYVLMAICISIIRKANNDKKEAK